MTVKTRECATVILGHDDVARILAEGVCGTFSMFENMRAAHVHEQTNGTFKLELEPKTKTVPVTLPAVGSRGAAG